MSVLSDPCQLFPKVILTCHPPHQHSLLAAALLVCRVSKYWEIQSYVLLVFLEGTRPCNQVGFAGTEVRGRQGLVLGQRACGGLAWVSCLRLTTLFLRFSCDALIQVFLRPRIVIATSAPGSFLSAPTPSQGPSPDLVGHGNQLCPANVGCLGPVVGVHPKASWLCGVVGDALV